MEFKIKLESFFNIKYIKMLNKQFFVVEIANNKYFYCLPPDVLLLKIDQFLYFRLLEKNNNFFEEFKKQFLQWFTYFTKPIVKKLILKGIGLKAGLLENASILELKLGYSHSHRFLINLRFLGVTIRKNIIIITGYNMEQINQFLMQIRKLRIPDSYKGKGVWLKNEQHSLKIIKKT